MTLEGANIFFDATDYTIYTMNSENVGQYCAVLPKNNNGTYNMIIDLHMKNIFDSVNNGSKTKEELIEEIKNEYMGVKTKYNDGILVIPMLDETLYTNAVVNNDKQKMFDKVKKIGAITSEIYKKLTDSGIDKQKIDQKIIMIIKNNNDVNFVDWLKEQMPNFVIGINLSELQANANNNPFMGNSNPFMPENETPIVSNDIFGTQPTPAESTVSNSVGNNIFNTPPVNEVAPTNDIFSTPAPAVDNVIANAPFQSNAEVQQQPIPEQNTQTEKVDIFGTPTTPVVDAQVATPVPEPVPVQNTTLEATTTINTVQQPTETTITTETTESIPEKKGSKGFTNLLILLVVLVGVTFISIELGKFLYNTYGV